MLASGTIPPGERHPIDMAGNDCDPIKRGSTNAGVVFEGTRYDTCANKTFTVFLWNTEANLRDYQLVKGGIDFYATALGEYVGGLSGMTTSEAAARYADWVFDQAYNEGGLLYGAGVRGLIFDIPQNDRWIAYWGRNIPTEIGATGDGLGDPRQLDNPCTRNAKMSLLGPEGETVLVNTNSFCGEAPAPGPG